MAKGFAEAAEAAVRPALEPDEPVLGIVAATLRKALSGSLVAVAVTDRRLLVQPLDRHLQAKEAPGSIRPGDLVSADVDGAGHGWWTAPSIVLDATAATMTLRTADGQKRKLMMMNGEGILGGLGGGEAQRSGLRALTEWIERSLAGR